MLLLMRRIGESLRIGKKCVLTVTQVKDDEVTLSLEGSSANSQSEQKPALVEEHSD